MALPTRVHRGQYGDPFETRPARVRRHAQPLLGRPRSERRHGGYSRRTASTSARTSDHFYVEAELPGFKKDEIDITLENQTLTISAEREDANSSEEKKGEHLLHERRYSRFLRSFTLPPTVDEQTRQRQAGRRRADDHAEQARGDQAAEDHRELSFARR